MKSYITTPIYYVNDVAHIGHAYTTIIADSLARYSRLKGDETYFLTGTDEHGQKIEQAAAQRGFTPQEYADQISAKFKELWDDFGISYDKFIRTTDTEHKIGVQHAFEKMYAKGDIYKGEYEGYYCVSCETFFTDTQLLEDGGCPDCGKPTSLVKEESYFFALSKYQDQILKWYQSEDKCIVPKGKKNEMISFVKQGLRDLSITRTSFDWGVKLPENLNDPKHVMYVWLDALMNYITALGYGADEKNMAYWENATHFVGKDILRFHAIYWPAFLLSLELPLPKRIASHGWWTRNGEKMSKSKGNVVNPKEVAQSYGLDSFRYFMLREVPFGQDGDFSQKALIDRINSDLGNGLGNLLNRIIGMSGKYSEYKISSAHVEKFYANELNGAKEILSGVESLLTDMQTNRYLEELWRVLAIANGAITEHEPWNKIKEGKTDEALALVALVANLLAKVTLLLSPIMPVICTKIATSLNFKISTCEYEKLVKDWKLLEDFTISQTPPLFPRIEEEKLETPTPTTPEPKKEIPLEGLIDTKEFFKSTIKVATILEANEVPKSAKLLKLKVDLGDGDIRQIVSGIKEYYTPAELVDTQVCVIANLKPAKIFGLESFGMLLAAKDEDGLSLVRPDKKRKSGSLVG